MVFHAGPRALMINVLLGALVMSSQHELWHCGKQSEKLLTARQTDLANLSSHKEGYGGNALECKNNKQTFSAERRKKTRRGIPQSSVGGPLLFTSCNSMLSH